MQETNWEENAYETEIWLVDVATAAARQLTNAKGSSRAAAWLPDGTSIAFLSDREEKTQISLIDPSTKQVTRLTHDPESMSFAFSFSRKFERVAFQGSDSKSLPEVVVADFPGQPGDEGKTLVATTLTDSGRQIAVKGIAPLSANHRPLLILR